jgi:hypothetical protein
MVDILMASYNGEKYIAEQIESILSQSYKDWKLIITDDCSNDNTFKIAKEYAEKYPDKIKVFQNAENSGNAGNNFFNMIKKSNADVIMTCDQDDIWLDDKIEITVRAFENVSEPMLVHTDLKIVDENGNVLKESMINAQHILPLRNKPNQLIVQNTVTGCVMALNKELADIIKVPQGQPVHDWYIAVIASLFGKIKYINKATILYRQHSDNYCGSVDMESMEYLTDRFKDSKKGKYMLRLGYNMAGEILRLYNVDNKMLKAYSEMDSYSKLKRLYIVSKYKIWKSGIIRKLGQIYFM